MIGLPTSVTSRTSRRSISAARASSAVSFARQPRTALVSSRSEPGLSITYETRLMRSSPNLICGFISPAEASTSPVEEVAEMPGDRRRADVERDPEGAVVQPRPDRGDRAPVVDGDGHRAVSFAQRRLQLGEHLSVGVERVEIPLGGERGLQPPEVARRLAELRSASST